MLHCFFVLIGRASSLVYTSPSVEVQRYAAPLSVDVRALRQTHMDRVDEEEPMEPQWRAHIFDWSAQHQPEIISPNFAV